MSDSTLISLDDAHEHVHPIDYAISKQVSEVLHKHYPDWLWAVNVDHRSGMIDIRNVHLTGQYGYRLKMGATYSASSLERDAIRAGGEILERFRVARGRFDEDRYATAETDFAGRLLFDKS